MSADRPARDESRTGRPLGTPPAAQSFEVTEAWVGLRLDRFLQAMIPRMSRAAVHGALADRVELASGLAPKPSRRLVRGEVVTIRPRRAGPAGEPAPRVAVLACGDGWLIVDKPAGISSTPSARHPGRDVASLCSAAPAHRLDRFTTGCLLLTTEAAAARHFLEVFRERRAVKVYAAIVEGVPSWRELACDEPLVPDATSRVPGRLRAARTAEERAGAPRALTRFELVASSPGPPSLSLVRAVPETGRRHQVRVHLAHLGLPVAGDLLHGGDERRFVRFQLGQAVATAPGVAPGRHLLHARRLEIPGPRGETIRAVAPWPSDFPEALTTGWRDGG